MKKMVLVFLLISFVVGAGFTQSLSLSYHAQKLDHNASIVRTGSQDSLEMTTWLMIKNESNRVIQIQAKKVEIKMMPGAAGSICFAGFCYQPGIYESLHPLTLAPDSSKTSCFAHFTPGGSVGESQVRWVYFDKDNPSDSVSVTITYLTFPSGVDLKGKFSSVAFPNPSDKEIKIKYSNASISNPRVVLKDLSGSSSIAEIIAKNKNELILNTSQLPAGVYLYSIEFDGISKTTGNFIIRH